MKLSPDHREIIDLVYYHEKSIEEMRAEPRSPCRHRKARTFYARKKLAELAQGCCKNSSPRGGAPALAQSQQQGTLQDRAASAPAVREFCKSANEDTMRELACLQAKANRAKIGAVCNRLLCYTRAAP